MKSFFLIALFPFLLLGCKQQQESTESAQANADSILSTTTDSVAAATIPSYNFDQFEEMFRNQSDDVTYVINFWATWCKPCIKELPAFEQINETYKDQGVKVVLVSLDLPDLLENQVIPFVEQKGLKSEVILLDDPYANTWIPKVAEEWSGAIPATLLIKGDQEKFYERSFTYEEIETELKTIL